MIIIIFVIWWFTQLLSSIHRHTERCDGLWWWIWELFVVELRSVERRFAGKLRPFGQIDGESGVKGVAM